jgi:hypothetical protein
MTEFNEGLSGRKAQGSNWRFGSPAREPLERGIRIQRQVDLIIAHGCHDCAGGGAFSPDGNTLFCKRLVTGERGCFTAEELARCGVPKLHARARAGKLAELDEAAVKAACALTDRTEEE